MPILNETGKFDPIAREFAVRYVDIMARLMHDSPAAAFDLNNLSENADNLLFNICFFGIAQSEEQSGFPSQDKIFTPLVAFETDKNAIERTILIGSTTVHGLVEDDVIAEGIARARERTITDTAREEALSE